jgi:hypothetical protein
MNSKFKNGRTYSKNNHTSRKRATRWAKAIAVRKSLRPIRDQKEVAAMLGMTHQAVEQAELRALTKVIAGFESYLIEEKLV